MTQPGTGEAAPSGTEPSAQSGAAGDGGTGTGAQSGATGDGTATDTTTQAAPETVSKADFDRTVAQLRAADQKRQAAETQLQQLRDKDLPEAERMKRDFQAVTSERDALKQDLQKARIENAFLKQNNFKWQDPEVALAVADMSAVTIDAEGNVTGLEDALKRLASAKPWMLLQEAATGEGNEDKGKASPPGTPPMNGKPGTNMPDRAGMAQKFPALRTRQRPSA